MNLRKAIILLFIISIINKLNGILKKDIADIIKEIYNKNDIKITKYNTRDGLFNKPTVEVKSKKRIINIKRYKNFRTFEVKIYRTCYKY